MLFIRNPNINLPLILIGSLVVARDIARNYLSELSELLSEVVAIDAESQILYEKFFVVVSCRASRSI